jgi:Fe-S-cluster containining protein
MTTSRRAELPMASANVSMKVGGYSVRFRFDYPIGPATTGEFLPAFRTLTDTIVQVSEKVAAEAGKTVSCKKGCGACCRQVVPVSPSEARAIARLVEEQPEPRRSELRARFAEAMRRMDEAGLGDRLRRLAQLDESEFRPFAVDYFAQRVACPFLEDESCSIHADRPMGCREFLATTPAENCSLPTPDAVQTVPLPTSVGNAVRRLEGGWLPLVLALEYAATPEPVPSEPGEEVLKRFLELVRRS